MRRLALLLVFATFAVLALVHLVRLPAFEGPDEPGNLDMVRFVALERRLPRPATEPTAELEALGRGLNPPLWFATLAPLHAAWMEEGWYATPVLNPEFKRRGGASALHHRHGRDESEPVSPAVLALRRLRATSIVWGLLMLAATAWAARLCNLCPWTTTALVALAPGVQHAAGTLTMDPCVGALGSLALACACGWIGGTPDTVRAGRAGPRRIDRWAFGAGALGGLAALAKLSGLVLVPCLAWAALVATRRGRGGARALLACALGWALTAGLYYGWGWLESGHPLWPWAYQRSSPAHLAGGAMTGNLWSDWGLGFTGMLLLTWSGNFGWTAAWVPFAAALALGVAYVAGLFGLLLRDGVAAEADPGARAATRYLVGVAAIALAAEAYFNVHFFQPQARHLLPFAPAFAIPLARGLAALRVTPFVLAFQLALSVFGATVVLSEFRPAGWNADVLAAATSAGREPRLEGAPARGEPDASESVEIAWRAPRDGAAVEEAHLAWEVAPDRTYELLLAVDNPGFLHRPWRGLRVHRASVELPPERLATLAAGELTLPRTFWEALPAGVEVRAQVLALDPAGRVAGHSRPLRFTRAP